MLLKSWKITKITKISFKTLNSIKTSIMLGQSSIKLAGIKLLTNTDQILIFIETLKRLKMNCLTKTKILLSIILRWQIDIGTQKKTTSITPRALLKGWSKMQNQDSRKCFTIYLENEMNRINYRHNLLVSLVCSSST